MGPVFIFIQIVPFWQESKKKKINIGFHPNVNGVVYQQKKVFNFIEVTDENNEKIFYWILIQRRKKDRITILW